MLYVLHFHILSYSFQIFLLFLVLTNPKGTYWPRQSREMFSRIKYAQVIQCETEFDLLEQLLKIISEVDPDYIVGYDCAFQLDVLMHRMGNLKVPNWSRMGRLKRSSIPSFKVLFYTPCFFIFLYYE